MTTEDHASLLHETPPPSYVVTLELDGDSFGWLDAMRRRHFPPDRNLLDAHLTLFHKLDDQSVAILLREIKHSSDAIPLVFSGLRSLGRGVAIEVTSGDLVKMRNRLAQMLSGRLTRQDEQSFRPHVTIQNKAEPANAKRLLDELRADFVQRRGFGTAILVWQYLGGPWRMHSRSPFIPAG